LHSRAICGLGIGWSKDEYQASNIPFKDRGKRADEFIQALKRIWIDDVVEFKGKFYNIPASKIGPKPTKNRTLRFIWVDLAQIRIQGL
jgi:alkanesulfonate monooxygenase SsuD/methylene tetrahydromethanopterin reductase-like flavin-dependent oxidoreductase (luciferase family)